MKKLTLTKAFAQFGAELKNPRWQVSALASDGSLVVSCWSFLLKSTPDGNVPYEDQWSRWRGGNRTGMNLLKSHLLMAIEHELPVRLVIATLEKPEDADSPSTDGSVFPKTFSTDARLVGRVVKLDDDGFAIEFP